MATIQIKSAKKTQDFTNDKGKKLVLSVNIGDTEKYASWVDKAEELKLLPDTLTDAEAIRKLKPLAKEIIIMLFGRFVWGKVYRFCGKNVFAVMKIIEAFSGIISTGITENVKK